MSSTSREATTVEIEITKATIIRLKDGPDKVYIYTTLPAPIHKELGGGVPLVLSFDVAYLQGPKYVRDAFGIEPELIDCRGEWE